MCGITGGIGPSAPSKQLLDAQLKSLEHRGPDDSGTYINNGIGLGMGRLAIVEIAAGKQPASDAGCLPAAISTIANRPIPKPIPLFT